MSIIEEMFQFGTHSETIPNTNDMITLNNSVNISDVNYSVNISDVNCCSEFCYITEQAFILILKSF